MAFPKPRLEPVPDIEVGSDKWVERTVTCIAQLHTWLVKFGEMPEQRKEIMTCIANLSHNMSKAVRSSAANLAPAGTPNPVEELRCELRGLQQRVMAIQSSNELNQSTASLENAWESATGETSTPKRRARQSSSSSSSSSDSDDDEKTKGDTKKPAAKRLVEEEPSPAFSPVTPARKEEPAEPTTSGAAPCPVCDRIPKEFLKFRCSSCKSFWNRLVASCQKYAVDHPSYPQPCLRKEHEESRPPKCPGCRRWRYEVALLTITPDTKLPIPSVTRADK
ncbi:hypothetical protein GE061_018931 [Apolygus lucorum]|uniref:Uncharacterized protein n=1 Tax=Apolygus lucorum TaxID=248454 RepID=A0A8S9X8B8_APOLU|nr:hypothetical protein GE061_018931 [Apolygus lucorum]